MDRKVVVFDALFLICVFLGCTTAYLYVNPRTITVTEYLVSPINGPSITVHGLVTYDAGCVIISANQGQPFNLMDGFQGMGYTLLNQYGNPLFRSSLDQNFTGPTLPAYGYYTISGHLSSYRPSVFGCPTQAINVTEILP